MKKQILAVVLLISFSFGCASASVKQQIDRSDRTAFAALQVFQTTESGLYHANAPWPSATQHQQVGAALSKAYTLVIDVANAGIALQPGAPLPAALQAEVAQLLQIVTDVLALANNAPPAAKQQAVDAQNKTVALTQTVERRSK
jgi:hypothetical protein